MLPSKEETDREHGGAPQRGITIETGPASDGNVRSNRNCYYDE